MRTKIIQLVNGRLQEVTMKEATKPPIIPDDERLKKYKGERNEMDELKKEENK